MLIPSALLGVGFTLNSAFKSRKLRSKLHKLREEFNSVSPIALSPLEFNKLIFAWGKGETFKLIKDVATDYGMATKHYAFMRLDDGQVKIMDSVTEVWTESIPNNVTIHDDVTAPIVSEATPEPVYQTMN